jgi:hypothetical protein
MHYVDLQRVNGLCESVHIGPDYRAADAAYRTVIDHASETVANVSWYFNLGNDQQHIGTRVLRGLR